MKTPPYLEADHLEHEFTTYFLFKPYPEFIPFTVKLPTEHHLPKGCIIDVETTGLNPETDDIITMGILQKDRAVIHQLTTSAYQQFRTYCRNRADRTPLPRYGYNTRFESEFLSIEEGWHDLTRSTFARGRLHLTDCTFSVFKEPDIIGADVPKTWQEWLNTHKPETLSQITLHCLADLLRTRQLIDR